MWTNQWWSIQEEMTAAEEFMDHHRHALEEDVQTDASLLNLPVDPLQGSSVEFGTLQRWIALLLRKDDTHKSRSFMMFLYCHCHCLSIRAGKFPRSWKLLVSHKISCWRFRLRGSYFFNMVCVEVTVLESVSPKRTTTCWKSRSVQGRLSWWGLRAKTSWTVASAVVDQ